MKFVKVDFLEIVDCDDVKKELIKKFDIKSFPFIINPRSLTVKNVISRGVSYIMKSMTNINMNNINITGVEQIAIIVWETDFSRTGVYVVNEDITTKVIKDIIIDREKYSDEYLKNEGQQLLFNTIINAYSKDLVSDNFQEKEGYEPKNNFDKFIKVSKKSKVKKLKKYYK